MEINKGLADKKQEQYARRKQQLGVRGQLIGGLTKTDDELQETITGIDDMPPEVLLKIIFESGLTIQDIRRLCSINMRFREICQDDQLWDRMFMKEQLLNYKADPAYQEWLQERDTMPDNFIHWVAWDLQIRIHNFRLNAPDNTFSVEFILPPNYPEAIAVETNAHEEMLRSPFYKKIQHMFRFNDGVNSIIDLKERSEQIRLLYYLLENNYRIEVFDGEQIFPAIEGEMIKEVLFVIS